MRELVECFQEWLGMRRTDANAYSLCVGLAAETLKRRTVKIRRSAV
jgi:hypothetical protein